MIAEETKDCKSDMRIYMATPVWFWNVAPRIPSSKHVRPR